MTQFISILLVSGGTLFWLYFFSGFDPHQEPKRVLAEAFLLGIASALAAVILEYLLLGTVTPASAFWIALIEELAKFLPVYFIILRRKEFDEPIDTVMYLLVAALGFSFAEDVTVAFSQGTAGVVFVRIFLAKLLHLTASGFIGYGYALSVFTESKTQMIWGMVAAVGWHWFYDYALILGGDENKYFAFIGFFLVFCLWYLVRILKSLEFVHSLPEEKTAA